MKKFIRNEIYGWTRFEVIWLLFTCIAITSISIYLNDSAMGIISAVTGIAYVIFAGKGKLSAYFFGLINCVLYSIISYKAGLYGETMLNTLYYIPMQFAGFFVWSKNIDPKNHTVTKKHMKASERIIIAISIGIATFLYGLMLSGLGDAMPYIDSFTTVSSVFAMIVSVKMYAEQWWIWLTINSLSIYMWWCNFITGRDNISTLLMWLVYLISGIIMLVKWEKDLALNKKTVTE